MPIVARDFLIAAEHVYVCAIDLLINGWRCGWMDGWKDGRKDGRTGRQMGEVSKDFYLAYPGLWQLSSMDARRGSGFNVLGLRF